MPLKKYWRRSYAVLARKIFFKEDEDMPPPDMPVDASSTSDSTIDTLAADSGDHTNTIHGKLRSTAVSSSEGSVDSSVKIGPDSSHGEGDTNRIEPSVSDINVTEPNLGAEGGERSTGKKQRKLTKREKMYLRRLNNRYYNRHQRSLRKKLEEKQALGNRLESLDNKPVEETGEPNIAKWALLEQPLIQSGKRTRKTIERLSIDIPKKPLIQSGKRTKKTIERLSTDIPKEPKLPVTQGQGKKLGDIPEVKMAINKGTADELKLLHKICFNRPCQAKSMKENLKQFSGFTFTEGSAEYEGKVHFLKKVPDRPLKSVCSILDVKHSSGHQGDTIERVMSFLMKPHSAAKKRNKFSYRCKEEARTFTEEDEGGDCLQEE